MVQEPHHAALLVGIIGCRAIHIDLTCTVSPSFFGRFLTTISFLSRLTAKKNDVTTQPKIAAITGMAAEMEPITSSRACVTQDAPDLPICTCTEFSTCRTCRMEAQLVCHLHC